MSNPIQFLRASCAFRNKHFPGRSLYIGALLAFSMVPVSGQLSPCIHPTEGLVSWWPGNSTATDVVDGNDGFLQNGVTFAQGKIDEGFQFDGLGSHVLVPHNANLSLISFSLAAWINVPHTRDEYQTIIAKSDHSIPGSETRNYGLFVNPVGDEFTPSAVHVAFASAPNTFHAVQGTTPVTDGNFHHVVATFDSSAGLRIFVDGVEETTLTRYPSGVGAVPGLIDAPLSIGCNSPLANSYGRTLGIVDEVAIYNRALTPEEIQEMFIAGSSGHCNATAVSIDIKPGSFPNSIKLGVGGTVPIAIFGTATFDASTVSPTTITLAGAAIKLKGNGTPMYSFEDINHDGQLDLVVHVVTEALQLSNTDTEALLQGMTLGGISIRGSDTVRIVP